MRIKLDENLPTDLAFSLRQLGHDVETVPEENLGGAADDLIWKIAQDENRFLITQDLDFSNVRWFVPERITVSCYSALIILRAAV
ncbi:MAG: DUF5615 family PIN-like protein [Anaerolineales bacterium]|nr:DUF5615 family PIN-like protein [Anaerolineales bacterium]